jgi:hypothetical protein
MNKYAKESEELFNPAKLADEAVLALSYIERGSEASLEFLQGGLRLCDYVMHLLQAIKVPETEQQKWAFRSVHDDRKALKESGMDIDNELRRTKEVREWISDLIDDPSSHSQAEIRGIKEYLLSITMPIWQSRTSEFRERKMKRSLIIHG